MVQKRSSQAPFQHVECRGQKRRVARAGFSGRSIRRISRTCVSDIRHNTRTGGLYAHHRVPARIQERCGTLAREPDEQHNETRLDGASHE